MRATLTISVPEHLSKELDALAEATGRSRSQIVRESLEKHLASQHFQILRSRLVPKARAAGLFTDEDVFREVS
jgi:predicted transcriptional regulator